MAGLSMLKMHKGMQSIHLWLRLIACDKKKLKKDLPFDVGNLDLETVGMDLLHCLRGSY